MTATNAAARSASVGSDSLVQVLAPVNSVLPSISGTRRRRPVAESDQWAPGRAARRPSPTSGRTATARAPRARRSRVPQVSSYTLAGSDAGHTIRVQVSATNSGGPPRQPPPRRRVVQVVAPANTSLPAISGSAVEGQSSESVQRDLVAQPDLVLLPVAGLQLGGSSCAAISGATNSVYTLTAGDVGHTLRAQVTATNAGGIDGGQHQLRASVVLIPAPVNTALPAISGSAVEGQSLKASNGTWSGSPTSFSYQWQDCNCSGASCSAISGATGSSYTLAGSDAGRYDQGPGQRHQQRRQHGCQLCSERRRRSPRTGQLGAARDQRLDRRRPVAESFQRDLVGQPDLVLLPVAGLRLLRRFVHGDLRCHASSYALVQRRRATGSSCR